jgi:CubicO group peptidase (beta-lactamase class C family)
MVNWQEDLMRLMRNLCLVLCGIVLLSTSAATQESKPYAQIDAIFAAYDKPDLPGCALGIIRDGQLVYTRGYGRANLEYDIPITAQTIFDIGSTSKQFAATSIHLLALQGKLSVDDEVRKYIPELPDYGKKLTIRNLLNHTSGVRDYLTLWGMAGQNFDDTTTSADALQLILRQKELNFAPGEEHLYSNSGYFLLSEIVKRASGMTLRQYAEKQIFTPLGMKQTHFHDDHRMIVRQRATGYAPALGGMRIDMSNFEQTGDGAVYTSVEELLLWDRNFYDPKVGGKELLDRLHDVGVLNNGEKLTYASGLIVDTYRGLKVVSHGGSWAGYRAELLRFPTEKTSIVCLCNLATTNPSRLARNVADVVLADKLQSVAASTNPAAATSASTPAATLNEEEAKKLLGIYRHESSGELRRVTYRDGKLRIDPFGPASIELRPIGERRFRLAGGDGLTEVVFENKTKGVITTLQWIRPGTAPRLFTTVAAGNPTPAQLAEYVGEYYSEELDSSHKLDLDKNQLTITIKGNRRTLLPTIKDGFFMGGPQVEFFRDAQGKVTGYVVNAGRTRNLRFVRRAK